MIKLGPGQIGPKGYQRMLTRGEVKLGLLMTKGQLEVEVTSARNILGSTKDTPPGSMTLKRMELILLLGDNFLSLSNRYIHKNIFER